MITNALVIIAGAFVPTKLLVRYLRSSVGQSGLKLPAQQQVFDQLDKFPDTWRPPFWLSRAEMNRALGK